MYLGGGCGDYRGRAGGLVAMSGPPVRFTCRARVSRHPTVGVAKAEGRCATAARGRRGSTTGLPAGRVTRARPPRRGPVACNVVHSSRIIHGAKHAMPAARARAAHEVFGLPGTFSVICGVNILIALRRYRARNRGPARKGRGVSPRPSGSPACCALGSRTREVWESRALSRPDAYP